MFFYCHIVFNLRPINCIINDSHAYSVPELKQHIIPTIGEAKCAYILKPAEERLNSVLKFLRGLGVISVLLIVISITT